MMKTFAASVAFGILAGLWCCAIGDDVPNPEQVLSKINQVVNIPQLQNLNTSGLPIQQFQDLIEKKCSQNGGETAYENAKQATQNLTQCVMSLIDPNKLKDEIEKAKPTGDLDVVFGSYCDKKTILKNCYNSYLDSIEGCLEPKERDNRKILENVTDALLQFICYKDGDRIALFIAAGGPECIQSKQAALQNCANKTFVATGIEKTNLTSIQKLPSLIFTNNVCKNMDTFKECAVKELETCEDPTPSNLVDAIFRFIKKVTPCSILS